MAPIPTLFRPNRIGFHYFPDALHYRESDLATWLPELQAMRAAWLVLSAPAGRAIPETFIQGLVQAGIQPVVHFPFTLHQAHDSDDLRLLFRSYARWGVQYAILFDRPNLRVAWPGDDWAQADLVERFLDHYLPLAEAAQMEGLQAVFPPLEPGGDFWDLAFLRLALRGLARRCQLRRKGAFPAQLPVLSAYANAANRPLSWGAGGPNRWPEPLPYRPASASEDQRGFHIFDWYNALAQAETGQNLPLILLRAGSALGDHTDPRFPAVDAYEHARRSLQIASRMLGEENPLEGLAPLPEAVLAGCFWLLSASKGSAAASQAWISTEGMRLPAVEVLQSRFRQIAPRPSLAQSKSWHVPCTVVA